MSAVSAAIALLDASVGHDPMHSMALRLVLSPSILPHIAQPSLSSNRVGFPDADASTVGAYF